MRHLPLAAMCGGRDKNLYEPPRASLIISYGGVSKASRLPRVYAI